MSESQTEIDRLTDDQYARLNAAVDHAFPRTTVGQVALAIVNEYLAGHTTSPTTSGASGAKRVWEIAREVGCTATQARAVLAAVGIETRSTSSKVPPITPAPTTDGGA